MSYYNSSNEKFREFRLLGFPVRKDVFDEQFKRLKCSEHYQGSSKRNSATKKEINILKSYIEYADRINRYGLDNSLWDILFDEITAYFDGEKDQESILHILENRINLYNKERSE